MTSDVVDKAILGSIVIHTFPKVAGLNEVGLSWFAEVHDRGSKETLVLLSTVLGLLVGESLNRRLVIGTRTLVVECHGAVTLEVGWQVLGRVDGKLSIVGTKTVAVLRGWDVSAIRTMEQCSSEFPRCVASRLPSGLKIRHKLTVSGYENRRD